ncbi:hypothetical protein AQI70_23770 [Streptomyces curacoi]|uniref:Uncharacterized protein n=1 Tax=Streptomyces curacoi TaxID=146536 RepID=A0A117P3C9_9ACTN|nr:hypothetical protein AQI70_23770 [Streptomyces curacoi]
MGLTEMMSPIEAIQRAARCLTALDLRMCSPDENEILVVRDHMLTGWGSGIGRLLAEGNVTRP